MNPIARFLYWDMNYHVEHHMFAGVPFYNLAELRKVIEPDLPPAYNGFFAAWKDILLFLRRQKADPAYGFEPPLPATARPPVKG
jgi:fatty acid desaturase